MFTLLFLISSVGLLTCGDYTEGAAFNQVKLVVQFAEKKTNMKVFEVSAIKMLATEKQENALLQVLPLFDWKKA